jgi:CheY-like chemotaxis protein
MPTDEQAHKWSYVFDEPTRILVVDDDPILREFASVYLSSPLAHVATVADAGTALDRMLREQFDVALIDIEMPGMDGFELVQQVRAHGHLRHLPIVMLTGREDIASIDRAYHLGATSFVTKPVNWRELSYQLRYVIRAGRTEADARARQAGVFPHAFHEAVSSIVGYAKLIAENGRSDPASVDYAENIAALGRELLRELAGLRDKPSDAAADRRDQAAA